MSTPLSWGLNGCHALGGDLKCKPACVVEWHDFTQLRVLVTTDVYQPAFLRLNRADVCVGILTPHVAKPLVALAKFASLESR